MNTFYEKEGADMYTIGQVAQMFGLPVSTLRYYDKEGLFPEMRRVSGIRQFSEKEIEALRVIECLKKIGPGNKGHQAVHAVVHAGQRDLCAAQGAV